MQNPIVAHEQLEASVGFFWTILRKHARQIPMKFPPCCMEASQEGFTTFMEADSVQGYSISVDLST